jgi:cleavage stimulation factor subunit 2
MKQGCSVFVGNIDFDVPEQRVVEELSTIGKVVSFRMMYDKATGKSKGYGFCEYESPLIAETAMKTLKLHFNGRPVKINYADSDLPTKSKETAPKPPQINNIVSALDSFDRDNLKEVIDYCKRMAVDQPTQLRELLDRNPNLVVAILSILVKLNLVDSDKVLDVVNRSFDPTKLKDQIAHRLSSVNDPELSEFTEDVKRRIMKLKYVATNKK